MSETYLGTYLLIRSKVVVISTAGSGSFSGPIFPLLPRGDVGGVALLSPIIDIKHAVTGS